LTVDKGEMSTMTLKNGRMVMAVGRGMALFLGLFTLLNVVGEVRSAGFDSSIWWIDLRVLPGWMGRAVLVLAGVAMVMVAFDRGRKVRVRWVVRGFIGGLLAVVIGNVVVFYWLLFRGDIQAGAVVPLSLFVAVALGVILGCTFLDLETGRLGRGQGAVFAGTFALLMVAFPLAQMFCFGTTDYRRRADAIVVFGAMAYADGTPSLALADRVNTGIALYKAGYAPVLIFSGGPSAGSLSEPEVMRNMALSQGVPAEAIVLDEGGLHTDSSVVNTSGIFERKGYRTVLGVSHFYHLPRIKMTYGRALAEGRTEVVTVPARETRVLSRMPVYVGREVVALWVYYLRPLWVG
jgi:uncharacterized SAM-binding protein YcdF (DUF218 family)